MKVRLKTTKLDQSKEKKVVQKSLENVPLKFHNANDIEMSTLKTR